MRTFHEADFRAHVAQNPVVAAILARWSQLALPDGWLVAGCLFQTVWNLQAGRAPGAGIKDYDLFYFDAGDTSEAAEARVQTRVAALLADLGVTVEVANQARVHLWYPQYFGQPYPALASAREGIGRFLVRETCVGIDPEACHAPHGLAGMYAGTLTPNPLTPYPELFARKAASYRERWSGLRIAESQTA